VNQADGTRITTLRFSMATATQSGFALDVPGAAGRGGYHADTLTAGQMTVYCTSLAGTLPDGTTVTFTPAAPPAALPASLTLTKVTLRVADLDIAQATAVNLALTA
jgi:hypothetical protein